MLALHGIRSSVWFGLLITPPLCVHESTLYLCALSQIASTATKLDIRRIIYPANRQGNHMVKMFFFVQIDYSRKVGTAENAAPVITEKHGTLDPTRNRDSWDRDLRHTWFARRRGQELRKRSMKSQKIMTVREEDVLRLPGIAAEQSIEFGLVFIAPLNQGSLLFFNPGDPVLSEIRLVGLDPDAVKSEVRL
jgi:hypothetical protein